MDVIERFYSKVNFNDESNCWEWTGGKFSNGYGFFKVNKKMLRAHRFSYEYFKGTLQTDQHIHHTCKNKICVNPDHLQQLLPKEHSYNSSFHNALKTHCKYGHEFTGENTRIKINGKRGCKTCELIQGRIRQRKNPQKQTEYTMKWRSKNKEKWKEYMQKYYQNCTK